MTSEGRIESIRTRLLNLSRRRGESFDFVLARYGVERFLCGRQAPDVECLTMDLPLVRVGALEVQPHGSRCGVDDDEEFVGVHLQGLRTGKPFQKIVAQ